MLQLLLTLMNKVNDYTKVFQKDNLSVTKVTEYI